MTIGLDDDHVFCRTLHEEEILPYQARTLCTCIWDDTAALTLSPGCHHGHPKDREIDQNGAELPTLTFLLMTFISLFFILFGITVILYPQFLAYIVGFVFLFIGLNAFFMALALRRGNQASDKKWSVGGYEIIKKRK